MRCPSCGHCFVPDSKPSLESMIAYALTIGLPQQEAEKAYDYYCSNGWRVGKVPMKDVNAALRNWKRNWEASGRPGLVRLAQSLPVKPAMGVWEIDKRLEAMRAEQTKLLNHPARQPRMEDYTWNDGQVSKVQNGWIYPADVQQKIDQLRIDINKLKEMKAQVPV